MKRRILAATLTITAAALIILGVPLGWSVSRVYRSQELSRLQQVATVGAAAAPAEGLRGPDPIELPTSPAGVTLTYYDTAGSLAAGRGSSHADPHASRALAGHPSAGTAGSRLAAAVPIISNETTVGAVEASSARTDLTARTERAWLYIAALGIVALIIAALIAIWQARRLTRPVESLVRAADRLGDGDFALTTPRSGVSELDRAGAALDATSARLGELMNRERSFTTHASHQLRTPLTALRLNLENALETPGADPRGSIVEAISEVDRLQDNLDQLFALARTGNPAGPRVPLREILEPIEQRWHAVLAQQGRRLRVGADKSTLEASAPASLGQILDILLDNATIHGQGAVDVSADVGTGLVRVEVHDEGDGITTIPQAASRGSDGHGLGLPLARSLAEGAGGTLVLRPRSVIAVLMP